MKKTLAGLVVAIMVFIPMVASASPQGKLSQAITAGTLTTDIKDASYVTVPLPSFNMTATNVSNTCQTGTGTYGSATQRIYVDNPGGADSGWTLSIAATDGATAKWVSGSDEYAFNDATGSGCTTGQLTLDPSAATLSVDGGGSTTGVTKGTSTAFTGATATTLLSASSSADHIWRGYLTGVGVSQKIPASTPAGTYTIDLTQTAVAI